MTLFYDDPTNGESTRGIRVPAGGRLTLQPFFKETSDGRRFLFPPRVIPLPSETGSGNTNKNSDVEIDFDVVPFGKKKRKNNRTGPDEPKYLAGTGSRVKQKSYSEGSATESLRDFWERVRDEQLTALQTKHDLPLAERLAAIEAAIQTLDVEFSDRYTPSKGWRCNVYATDLLSLVRPVFDAYLPKQWWNHARNIMRHRSSYQDLVEHGDGTHAQEEGAVNKWLHRWGPTFGWRLLSGKQSEVLAEGQDAANDGRLVLYSWADYYPPGTSGFGGHVGLIVAETDSVRARRYKAGGVRMPVVSQAGVKLYDRHVKGFNLKEKEDHGGTPGVFVHEPENDQSRYSPEVVSRKHKADEIRPGRLTSPE